tara:strand:- start:14487 stop:14981 length:495 start_codon:yes stop_codon:yes gene_type:complete
MDSKTLIKALKTAVRQVIKEELTEILRDGLQDTINEIGRPKKKINVDSRITNETVKKSKVQFTDNKWASILNETDPLMEQQPGAINSLAELMNEGMDDIHMTSADARGFGMMRQNMGNEMTSAPKVMDDPETGKTYEVAPEVAKALTRDYSQLMKAINNKKGIN